MRLISTYTLEVKEFLGDPLRYDFPKYAILSHTWGPDEVSLKDMSDLDTAKAKAGFGKIARCCSIAHSEGLDWAWVDTCCIDKSSSAELSEAINSMFKWYQAATVCYAYLDDVLSVTQLISNLDNPPTYREPGPRWFTRGWTLQELIAPFNVIFYSASWSEIGTKLTLCDQISQATGIPTSVLRLATPLSSISVGSRMFWARNRKTTRPEDIAYCLLGIFDLNMPLLYGEGDNAFMRLQAEILATMGDHSIFLGGLEASGFANPPDVHSSDTAHIQAMVTKMEYAYPHPLLSPSPSRFCMDMKGWPGHSSDQWDQPQLTRRVIQLSLPLRSLGFDELSPPASTLRTNEGTEEEDCLPELRLKLREMNERYSSLFLGAFQFYDARRQRVLVRYFVPATKSRESHTSILQLQTLDLFYWADIQDVKSWTTTKCEFALEDPVARIFVCLSQATFAFVPDSLSNPQRTFGWRLGSGSRLEAAFHIEYAMAYYIPNEENTRKSVAFFAHGYAHPKLFCCFLVLQSESESFDEEYNTFYSIVLQHCDDPDSVSWVSIDRKLGPVYEVNQIVPVDGGSAEMVVTVFSSVEEDGVAIFHPVFRFRNFADGTTSNIAVRAGARGREFRQ